MDMLPIKPVSGDTIKPTTGTANDGGSKSQSGYINLSGQKEDEFRVSEESKLLIGEEPEPKVKDIFAEIKKFFMKIIRAVKKFFGLKVFKPN